MMNKEENLTLLLCKRAFVSPIARRCSISSKATPQNEKRKGLNIRRITNDKKGYLVLTINQC